MTVEGGNVSVIGRLLEEISWEGSRVKQYREGGRGMENVLTAEVLLPLTYLPRAPFLAPVLRSAHGASAAVELAAAELRMPNWFCYLSSQCCVARWWSNPTPNSHPPASTR